MSLLSAQLFERTARQNQTEAKAADEPLRHTDEDLEALGKLLTTEEKWFKELQSAQEALKPFEDPILRRSELERRARNIQAEQARLGRKKAPRRTSTAIPASSTEATASAAEPSESALPRDEL